LPRTGIGGYVVQAKLERDSDVDILVEVDPSISLRFVTLAERLELLLDQHVDLISSRAVKPNLLKQIQAELIDV
jgi:predicted nucleotidyltransferase